jgi:predicted ribosomally synthesized peptide with nif11-like leader
MSEEQLKAFLEIAKLDDSLQARIKECSNVHQFVALAKELGYSFSVFDLKVLIDKELTDEDLNEVRGGRHENAETNAMILLKNLTNKLN